MTQAEAKAGQVNARGHAQRAMQLGPILCWAVVFADIGTSVYYIPGARIAGAEVTGRRPGAPRRGLSPPDPARDAPCAAARRANTRR
jgi:hypothetical protein